MSELKPCPLCGGIMKINKSLCLTAKGKRNGYSGRCTSCGMRTQMKFTEAEAIVDTNRRAEPENNDYMDGVKYAIYEIMKEVDIPGSNEICNGGDSDDEMCVQAAIRILEELIETPVNEPPICPLLSDSEVKQQCVEGPCPGIPDEPLTWTAVSERLPKEADGRVLIFDGNISTGIYSEFDHSWCKGDMCAVGGNDVTHWMPLPHPPEYTSKLKEDKAK